MGGDLASRIHTPMGCRRHQGLNGPQYVAIPTGPSLIGNRVVRQLTPEIPLPSRGSALLSLHCLVAYSAHIGVTVPS